MGGVEAHLHRRVVNWNRKNCCGDKPVCQRGKRRPHMDQVVVLAIFKSTGA